MHICMYIYRPHCAAATAVALHTRPQRCTCVYTITPRQHTLPRGDIYIHTGIEEECSSSSAGASGGTASGWYDLTLQLIVEGSENLAIGARFRPKQLHQNKDKYCPNGPQTVPLSVVSSAGAARMRQRRSWQTGRSARATVAPDIHTDSKRVVRARWMLSNVTRPARMAAASLRSGR